MRWAHGYRSTRRSRTHGGMEYLCVSFLVPSMYHVRTVRTVIIDFKFNDCSQKKKKKMKPLISLLSPKITFYISTHGYLSFPFLSFPFHFHFIFSSSHPAIIIIRSTSIQFKIESRSWYTSSVGYLPIFHLFINMCPSETTTTSQCYK